MNVNSRDFAISAVLIAFLVLPIGLRAELPRYHVMEIGADSVEDAVRWRGVALNSSGMVAGTVYLPETLHDDGIDTYPVAFLWNGDELLLAESLPSERWARPFTTSEAIDLNDDGWVILNPSWRGTWWYDYDNLALWDGFSSVEHRNEIPVSFLGQSRGTAVNNSRQVLGQAFEMYEEYYWPPRAFVWDGESTQYIFELGEHWDGQPGASYPVAINDSGHVIGYYDAEFSEDGLHTRAGFIFDGTSMHHLDFIPVAINLHSNVAGYLPGENWWSMDGRTAVIWDGVSAIELTFSGASSSEAHLINDSDQVLFTWYSAEDHIRRVALWDAGIVSELGDIGGDTGGGWWSPYSMNNSGAVTGTAGGVAFIADGEPMRDLNELVSTYSLGETRLVRGVDINDAGQILVDGQVSGVWVQNKAYLLTPVLLLIDRLEASVMGVGSGRQLASNVDTVRRHYEAGRHRQTCSQLDRLEGNLAKAGAPEIIDDVSEIKTAIDCP